MDSLRIVLVIIGIGIIVGLVVYDRFLGKKNRLARKSRRQAPKEETIVENDLSMTADRGGLPSLDEYTIHPDSDILRGGAAHSASRHVEPILDPVTSNNIKAQVSGNADKVNEVSSPPNHDLKSSVLSLSINAAEGQVLDGSRLHRAMEESGFVFGKMDIYHRMDQGESLISIANLAEPGTFDPDQFAGQSFHGIWIFSQLPSTQAGVDLVEEMLEAAKRIAKGVDGVLCDSRRQPLSPEVIDQMRLQASPYAPMHPSQLSAF